MPAVMLTLPLLAGCVTPTNAPAVGNTESDRAPFRVELVAAGHAPRPTGRGGFVDGVAAGSVTVILGWSPADDATLLVVTAGRASVLDERRYIRRDAAAVMGNPAHPDLGFRIVLRSLDVVVDKVCVLARRPDGEVLLLNKSDPSLCPSA